MVSSFSLIQLTIVYIENEARTFLTRSASSILRTLKKILHFFFHNCKTGGVIIPLLSIGMDFPASWYLIVAIPEAEGEVVEKDMV